MVPVGRSTQATRVQDQSPQPFAFEPTPPRSNPLRPPDEAAFSSEQLLFRPSTRNSGPAVQPKSRDLIKQNESEIIGKSPMRQDTRLSGRPLGIAATLATINCATVATRFSVSAVEILNQIASGVATSAKPTHNGARAQTFTAGLQLRGGRVLISARYNQSARCCSRVRCFGQSGMRMWLCLGMVA